MSHSPLVSVVVPTYNRAHVVGFAVESILGQQGAEIEVVVVDDGSTDATLEALAPYRDRIKYVHQENRGVSAARNLGVRQSSGSLLAFLDSDDVWAPGKLQAQLAHVGSAQVCSFEGVAWFVDRKEDEPRLAQCGAVKWPRCAADGFVIDPVLDVADGRYLHLGSLLCHKSTFLQVGFFDEALCMGEDEDWFSRASLQTRFHYLDTPYLRRRFHASQTVTEDERALRSLIAVFGNIKQRTKAVHKEACSLANKRLAAKWSHLANLLARQGRMGEARRAAREALALQPHHVARLAKLLMYAVHP